MAQEKKLPTHCDRYSYILAQVANYHKRHKDKFFDEASSQKVLAESKKMSLNGSIGDNLLQLAVSSP